MGMMVLGSMAAVALSLVKIVVSSFDSATRPGGMVARMDTAVGLVIAARWARCPNGDGMSRCQKVLGPERCPNSDGMSKCQKVLGPERCPNSDGM